jgi:hypothetical protein
MLNEQNVAKLIDSVYINYWGSKNPVVENKTKFTEMELALMEGGHSLDNPKLEKFSFIKSLEKKHLP